MDLERLPEVQEGEQLMAQQTMAPAPPQRTGVGRIGWWVLVVVSFGLLAFLILSEVIRFSTPAQLHRLQIMQDIPLPDALPDPHRTSQNPFAAGQAQRLITLISSRTTPVLTCCSLSIPGLTRIKRPPSYTIPISMSRPMGILLSLIHN